jgi:uncharacterized protein (DUF58 family)
MALAETATPRTTLSLGALIETRHDILKQTATSVVGGVALPGPRSGPKRGQGLEFVDLRQYNDGDDVRHIDWNVTARTNQPYTRLYREEKENTTTVVVDLRRHMYTGSDSLRAVRAGLQAARALWQSLAGGDRIAAIVCTDHEITETRPLTGRKGALSACELIADKFKAQSNATTTMPLHELLLRLNRHTRQSGRYVVFSGFDERGEAWQQRLNTLGAAQRTTGVITLDRMEHIALPAGRYHYRDRQQLEASTSIDRRTRDTLQQELQVAKKSIKNSFDNAGVPLIVDYTDAPYEHALQDLMRGTR